MNCSQWIWPASVGTNMRLKNEAASFQKPTCGKELKHDILILSLANLELGFVQAMNPFYYTVIFNQKYHLEIQSFIYFGLKTLEWVLSANPKAI